MKRNYYEREVKEVRETRITTEKGWVDVDNDFWKTYVSGRALMARIKSICARRLFDFLLETMSDYNVVHNNKTTRAAFIEDCIKLSGDNYHDTTVKDSFKDLVVVGLLTMEGSGMYIVNVEYFSKLPAKERVKLIIDHKESQRRLT